MAETLLQVRNLRITFPGTGKKTPGIKAVRGVSFELEEGEILGIVGESGSGKSVTMAAVPGLLPDWAEVEGSVRYRGEELLGKSKRELAGYRGKEIAMIFQEPGRSFDPLQSMESVFLETFRRIEKKISREESKKKAVKLLEEVGIKDGEGRIGGFPHQFSGGQLQRISIALALACKCRILVADEPTTALDVTVQAQIINLIKGIRDREGISVVLISHDIDVVSSVADRIAVLYGGLIMEYGKTSEILENPAHPYTRALLKSAPEFGSHYTMNKLNVIPGKVCDPSEPPPGCPFYPRCLQVGEECRNKIPEFLKGKSTWYRCCNMKPEKPEEENESEK